MSVNLSRRAVGAQYAQTISSSMNVLAVAVISALTTACSALSPSSPDKSAAENDSGKVIEFTTRQPIEGATVRMECQKPKFHGNSVLWVAERLTAADGAFSFRSERLSECPQIMVNATKATHWDAGGIPNVVPWNPNERIPTEIYLVEDKNVHRLRMEQLFRDSGIPRFENDQRINGPQFSQAFGTFEKTISFAIGEADRLWIRNKYCDSLHRMMMGLSESSREFFSKPQYGDSASYIGQITAYCK